MDKNKKDKLNEEILAIFVLMSAYQKSKYFKNLLAKYKLNRDQLKDKVNRIYAKYSKDGELVITQDEINKEMKGIVTEIKSIRNDLESVEKIALLFLLENSYTKTYRDINKKLGLDKVLVATEISRVVNRKIKGITPIYRINSNKMKLSSKLIIDIKQQLKKGVTIEKINKSIDTTFEQGVRVSQRLIGNELARVTNEAIIQSYKVNGITKVGYNSALEKNTCQTCESLDGVIFDIDNAPSLPLHTNCMCWYEIEE